MNAKQTKLIEQAASVDTDGEGWRKRMEAWLDTKMYENIHPYTAWMDRVLIDALLSKS